MNAGEPSSEDLKTELVKWVRREIGPIATPGWLQWAPGLLKTRSGKIICRILRKIAEDDFSNLERDEVRFGHLTAFSRLLARHASCRGLVDLKRSITTSSGREKTALGWAKFAHLVRCGACPMHHIALRTAPAI